MAMTAEYEYHRGTFLLYPGRTDVWRQGATPAQNSIVRLANTIAHTETVWLGVSAGEIPKDLSPSVLTVSMPYDDAWIRDTGPVFTDKGGVCFDFNAWGGRKEGLYWPCESDRKVARTVCGIVGTPAYSIDFVAEGGALTSDGNTLLAVEPCVLNPNRNGTAIKLEAERLLTETLTVERIIWLPEGFPDDETGGHVDNLCLFVSPGRVLLAWTDNRRDALYYICRRTEQILEKNHIEAVHMFSPPAMARRPQDTQGLTISRSSKNRLAGQRLPATYVNFYMPNGLIIAPQFGIKEDERALTIFSEVFPERRIVPFDAYEFILGGGGIHCMTKEIPVIEGEKHG